MQHRRWLSPFLFVLLLCPVPASAQTPAEDRRARARTFLVLRIAEALKLSDADALKVSKVIRDADDHRQELVKQRQALEDKLRAALDKQPVDENALAGLIRDGNDLDRQIALVPEESFTELQKTLTVEQQAKLLLFRREMQGEIRRAMQTRRQVIQRRGGPAARAGAPTKGGGGGPDSANSAADLLPGGN